jgi:hypothetical protein
VRLDGSPKPAYEALLGLVKGEWWLEPTPMVTDAQGELSFSGFLGDYEVLRRRARRRLPAGAEGSGVDRGERGGL